MLRAVDIEWDFDVEEGSDMPDLPSEVEIPENITDPDEVSDFLSDLTGFCHLGFRLVENDDDEYDKGTDDVFNSDDRCYECGGYGDDYYTDNNGELQCSCDECPFNPDGANE